MSLKKAATSGLIWTFLDTAVSRGISLFASILLARLLLPEDFGLMGMIYIITSIAAALVESGLTISLIRTTDVDEIDYSTIFYTNIIVSSFLYGIVYILSPSVAIFYDQNALTNILRVYGLIFVINSLSAVQIARLTKSMQFRKLMVINIPGITIGAVCGIYMAYHNYGVWSIIMMQLITQFIFCIVIWFTSTWKPTLDFSIAKLKVHFNFGYKLMLSGLLNACFNNVYNVMIGKFFSTSMLGQFERAKSYSDYPAIILTTMIGKVTYPLLATIKDETERLTLVYKKILKFAFFISAPLLLTLSAISEPLFIFVLGEKWAIAGSFFKILCLASLLYPIHAFNLNLLKVLGRSDLFLKLEIIKKFIIVIFAIIAFQFGVIGLVWSILFSSVGALIVNTYYTKKLIGYSIIDQIKDVKIEIITSILMYLIMYSVINNIEGFSIILQMIITSLSGIVSYLAINILIKNESLQFVLEFRKNLK